MAGSSNPDKDGLREDLEKHDAKEKEKTEATEGEEETPNPTPTITIASIGVVPSKPKAKQGARMSTGGKIPRRFLAPKTFPSSTKRPFHTLIHKYPFEKVPPSELPSSWDMDRSNHAGKRDSKTEVPWGNNSKSWDSPSDRMMNRIEQNTELVRTLIGKVDDLMEVAEKIVRKLSPPSPPRE